MARPVLLLVVVALLSNVPAEAQWQEGGALLDLPEDVNGVVAAPDGEGGMIVAWRGIDAGQFSVHAQRVDGLGNLLWGAQGVTVCAGRTSLRHSVQVTPDGAGGAYVVWVDERLATITSVFAQHLEADGTPTYAADGLALVTGANFSCYSPDIAPTADGGAVVTWLLVLGSTNQVRVQRLDPGGHVWSYGGVIVRASTEAINSAMIAELRDGTVCCAFAENDVFLDDEIFAVGLGSDGAALWGPVLTLTNPENCLLDDVLADDLGGMYVVTTTYDDGSDDYDVQLGFVASDGSVTDAAGVYVCDLPQDQAGARLAAAPDGVWVAWIDRRDDPESAIYVQRMDRGLAPRLAANGHEIVRESGYRLLYGLVPDGQGGAVLQWLDKRWADASIYFVQRVDQDGNALWPQGGVSLRADELVQVRSAAVGDGAGGLICVIEETQPDGSRDLVVQRIERNGYWGYPAAAIQSIVDVPADQGGAVALAWTASRLDPWPEERIGHYSLWRALSPAKAATADVRADWRDLVGRDQPVTSVVRAGEGPDKATAWFLVGTVDAGRLPGYAEIVPTFADSTGADPADQVFQVVAHGLAAEAYWFSAPATGRSVDNLAPGMPQNLAGNADYGAGGLWLDWNAVAAPDLDHYSVHRGITPFFVPGDGNRVAAPADTLLFDGGWDDGGGWHYKVGAVDIHGNVSLFALLAPAGVSAVGDGDAPAPATALRSCRPNPFNPRTTIAYDLAAGGHVRLLVHDAAGRRVRTLVDAWRPQGRNEVVWDGRDAAGRTLASGGYLCRLQAGGEVRTLRMTLLK